MALPYDPQEVPLVPSEPDDVGASSSGSAANEHEKKAKKQKRLSSSLLSLEEPMDTNTFEDTIAALRAKLVTQKIAHEAELRSGNKASFRQHEIMKRHLEKKVEELQQAKKNTRVVGIRGN